MRMKDLFFAMSPKRWLLRVLQGILVGSGAILPGISGGVLCVSFGLYQPMMALFAHPFRNFRSTFPQLFPAGIGWLLGFFAFAKLITLFFSADSNLAIWLFIGLIAGSFPGLYRQAGQQGRTGGSWLTMLITLGIMLASFLALSRLSGFHIQPNLFWFAFCGVLWGLSLVIPGMTSSTTLIFLGLFEPMTAGVAAMDPGVLIPMMLGVAVTIIVVARVVNRLFDRHYSLAFHGVLGFVIASTVVIVPVQYTGVGEFLRCLLFGAVGFAATYWLDWRDARRKNNP
jgi:putative membrane protein